MDQQFTCYDSNQQFRTTRTKKLRFAFTLIFTLAPSKVLSFHLHHIDSKRRNHPVWRHRCFYETTERWVGLNTALGWSTNGLITKNEIATPENSSDDSEGKSMPDDGSAVDEGGLLERRKRAAARAALLAKQGQSTKRSTSKNKESKRTSVGERRIGSATIARNEDRATTKIVETIRKTAIGTSSNEKHEQEGNSKNNGDDETILSTISVSQSVIQLAIEDLLKKHSPQEFPPMWDDKTLTEAFANFGKTIGIIGETAQKQITAFKYRPGSVILEAKNEKDVSVRMATPSDDVDIANLRLSVFSDFTPDMYGQFCYRSCQAISARRLRGAICVVATGTRKDVGVDGCESRIIVGTAECSFHEFVGTQLGRRRLPNSIIYITEVAVNPAARKQGIGTKMLSAIEMLSRDKGIESLYLHVDVTNDAALKLYRKAGYREVDSSNPMYLEFTTSLNLHPGATKGRNHVLLCTNLTSFPNWIDDPKPHRPEFVCALGFEIPA